jgi:hypothetical protein
LMQANDVCAGCVLNHLHQNRPRLFDQLGSDLLEQVSPFFRREPLDKMLLRVRQDAAKADQYKITNQVRVYVLGATAHEFLLKTRHPLADSSFNLAPCFHFGNVSSQRLATAC